MSDKDVLHIPPEAYPTAPEREADTGRDDEHPHHGPSAMHPGDGPGGPPGVGGNPHIIEPATTPRPYPGVSVS